MKRLVLVFFLIVITLSTNTAYAVWPSFGYEDESEESKQVSARLIEAMGQKITTPIEINSKEPAAGLYAVTINEEDEGSYDALRAHLQVDQGDIVTNEIATAWLDAKTLSIVQGDESNQYTLTGEGIRFVLTLTLHEEEEHLDAVEINTPKVPPVSGGSGKNSKYCCNLL